MDCTNLEQLPLVLSVDELARVLHIGKNSAYDLIRSGKIRSTRIGRQIRIPRTALEAFLGAYSH